jgi:hypothetical protein
MITHDNFHISTKATFKSCKKPKRTADFISRSRVWFEDGKGSCFVSSCYWYGEDNKGKFVIRYSDHWGQVASCNWEIDCREEKEFLFSHRNNKTYHIVKQRINASELYVKSIAGKCYLRDFSKN